MNANSYRFVRRYLDPSPDPEAALRDDGARKWRGGHDWLGHFGPRHEISDPDGKPQSIKDFVRYCRQGNRDKYGRKRKRTIAYRGILSPPTLVQIMLRDLCLRAPHHAERFFDDAFRLLRDRLKQEFEGVPVQLAFHINTGRAHWEWIVPKYHRNRVARRGVKWDSAKVSIRHALAKLDWDQPNPKLPPKLNSVIALDFYRHLVQLYVDAVRRAGVSLITKNALQESEEFFLRVQEQSLRDGMLSRRHHRAADAERELARNLVRQRARKARRIRQWFVAVARKQKSR